MFTNRSNKSVAQRRAVKFIVKERNYGKTSRTEARTCALQNKNCGKRKRLRFFIH
jgi:hypothetical protein